MTFTYFMKDTRYKVLALRSKKMRIEGFFYIRFQFRKTVEAVFIQKKALFPGTFDIMTLVFFMQNFFMSTHLLKVFINKI